MHIRPGLEAAYPDVYTPECLHALAELLHFNGRIKAAMEARLQRRAERFAQQQLIGFLDPASLIPGTGILVQDARDGRFEGAPIPADLKRQWIQGTGPAAKPDTPVDRSIRNVAYALLSGADGWMFDGEDALGQTSSMSLDNQRNLKLAYSKDPVFMEVAASVAGEMNRWAAGFLGKEIITDWESQLRFTTRLFRPRGLHLDDRHLADADGNAIAASLVDTILYVVNNYRSFQADGSTIVLYLPKIQTAGEAAVWNAFLTALEQYLQLPVGSIRTYVLVEQLEATYQLMEIRAALGKHFAGFNTGRWDYINSVSDAMAWNTGFINPNIESIVMTYGYMRNYEDRVRRAVNTPDIKGNYALWQGGMEPNIPVGSKAGVEAGMQKAMAGAEREQREGASGKWVAHWKMAYPIRSVWEKAGEDNQMGRKFPPLTYTRQDAEGLILIEPAPTTIRGARNLLSVALQYGNAFGQGMQAAALKGADFFGNDDILYLMEDMATGEIRLSILWEWVCKGAILREDDPAVAVKAGDLFSRDLFNRLLREEYQKLLDADNKDVYDNSKHTSLPISREITLTYVLNPVKLPWFVDLLNINLNNTDLDTARKRIDLYDKTFVADNERITRNLDFNPTQ